MSDDIWKMADLWDEENPEEPLILRLRSDLDGSEFQENMPIQITISWSYAGVGRNMPDKAVSEQMRAFEEAIGHLCDGTETMVLSYVLTGQGSRRWHIYAKSVEDFSKDFHEAMRDRPFVPIRIEKRDDPDWECYEEMLAYTEADEQ